MPFVVYDSDGFRVFTTDPAAPLTINPDDDPPPAAPAA